MALSIFASKRVQNDCTRSSTKSDESTSSTGEDWELLDDTAPSLDCSLKQIHQQLNKHSTQICKVLSAFWKLPKFGLFKYKLLISRLERIGHLRLEVWPWLTSRSQPAPVPHRNTEPDSDPIHFNTDPDGDLSEQTQTWIDASRLWHEL